VATGTATKALKEGSRSPEAVVCPIARSAWSWSGSA
jgi:hypothetical protein